ncbi:MAG: hypothetical protein AAFQ94_16165 [Bacteroidota bacterium]
MKTLLSLLIVTLVTAVSVTAQFSTGSQSQLANFNDVGGSPIKLKAYNKVEGNPYFNDGEWTDGVITGLDGKIIKGIKIRYNSFEDALEYRKNNGSFLLDGEQIKGFAIIDVNDNKNDIFKTGFGKVKNYNENGFFKVIFDEGDISILEKVISKKITVTPAAYGESDYEKFVHTTKTYFKVDGQVSEGKVTKKNFMKLFPEYKNDIKKYLSDNDNSLSTRYEIQNLCNFLIRKRTS